MRLHKNKHSLFSNIDANKLFVSLWRDFPQSLNTNRLCLITSAKSCAQWQRQGPMFRNNGTYIAWRRALCVLLKVRYFLCYFKAYIAENSSFRMPSEITGRLELSHDNEQAQDGLLQVLLFEMYYTSL